MTITIHHDLIQGSDEWLAARCGLLTASEVKLILTPTLKKAANDKSRAHAWELAAQRITGYVEPAYISDDMLRGQEDEILARDLYSRNFAPVEEVGFVTNDGFGFTLGCSPDGFVGEDGLIEIKSRRQRFQVETIVAGEMPADYLLQVQTAMLVTGRSWCDFISYSGGMPMMTLRIHPDDKVRAAILEAAAAFEEAVSKIVEEFNGAVEWRRLIPTERRIQQEITL